MNCKGMTLLELLVAVSIFALLAGAGYAGLDQGIDTAGRLEQKRLFWSRLESLHSLVQTDLNQAIRRPPRVPAGTGLAFRGEEFDATDRSGTLFSFTRGGMISFNDGPASPYRRVSYSIDNGTLYRTVANRVDTGAAGNPRETELLTGIRNIGLRYLVSTSQWARRWPQTLTPEDPAVLPGAIEFSLEFEEHGRFVWLFNVGVPR